MLLEATSSIPDAVLTRRALLVAAAYRLHCRHRRSEGLHDEVTLTRALDQAVKESTLGHKGAMRQYDSIWVQTATTSCTPPSTSSSSSREAAS
jgi:hypothetical protein